jgi:multidrug efflux pump subunit AcrB
VLTLGIELRFTTEMIQNAEWGRLANYAGSNFLWLVAHVVTLTARKRWMVLAGFGLLIALTLYYYGEFTVDFFPQTSPGAIDAQT